METWRCPAHPAGPRHDKPRAAEYTRIMLQRLRHHLPALARVMLGVFGGVWFTAATAPCVMAAPCVPPAEPSCHEAPATPNGHSPDCPATGAIDCQLPTSYSPATFDLADHLLVLPAATVPRLATLPANPRGTWVNTSHAGGIPAPPLYLQHLALLL